MSMIFFTQCVTSCSHLGSLYKNKTKYVCQVLCGEGRPGRWGRGSRVQSQTFWRNKHPESYQILLWSGAVYWQEESSEITYNIWGLKSVIFALINLSAAAVWRADCHRQVFMFCNVDHRLELEGKCTICHDWPELKNEDIHCLCLLLLASLQLMYSKVICLFWAE